MSAPVVSSSEDLFTVTVATGAHAVRVGASGEIDAFTAPQLVSALGEAVDAGVFEITVDLQDVTFLDSAGVHAIAAAYRRARAAGICLRVRSPQRGVRRTLELSGLWSLVGDGERPASPRPEGDRREIRAPRGHRGPFPAPTMSETAMDHR